MLRSSKAWVATIAIGSTVALVTAAPALGGEPRIVGGTQTTIQQFPWQVAVAESQALEPGEQNGYQRQFCGGTLVAPTIVITAAHCVYEFNPVLTCSGVLEGFNFPAADFAVFTGRTTLSSNEGQEINVAEIYYFEGSPSSPTVQSQSADPDTNSGQLYNCETNEWDAVFLRLAQPSTTGVPIQIAGGDESAVWAPGTPAKISGWGCTSQKSPLDPPTCPTPYPDELHAATISILNDSDCASSYGPDYIPSTMLCAGVVAGGVDTCQGDSGGPLVVPAETGGRIGVRLVGDTSFGAGCGHPSFPGIYGRLAADPMRSAFGAGIQQVAGVNVVGSGARPVGPPETAIGKHPKKKVKTRKRKVTARFTFTASEPASFECKLDKRPFRACGSPFRAKVKAGKRGGKPKKHSLQVRAIDSVGQTDASAAKFNWSVRRLR